ncbi:MAG TPA: hypothetical protein VMY36_04285 [Patescibacteria group bacterium]|nr:hypothetical protein [Patescibacteria group bacterium]
MPKFTRDLARQAAQQARDLGEEILKEGLKQPGKILETAAKQIGILPKGWGENLEPSVSQEVIRKKKTESEKKQEKELAFWRQRKRDLASRPREAVISQEEIEKQEKQKELIETAKKEKPLPETPSRTARGSAFLPLRVRKSQGTGEIKGGI